MRTNTTIGIIVSSTVFTIPKQGRYTYPFFHILSISLYGQPEQSCKFSLFCGLLQGLVVWPEIMWSVCISKSQKSLCVSFSRTDFGLCIYYLFEWSNFNFLHNSQWITLPTQSCLVLYSFCVNLLHSLIVWLIVSSLSPYNQHLLFCCVLSIFFLIWLVLTALFCAAIRRDSVSLLKFPFLTHVHVFSCEMSLVNRLKLPQKCFSSHFCFLVIVVPLVLVLSVLFLVAVISPPSCFLCSPRVVISMCQRYFQCW